MGWKKTVLTDWSEGAIADADASKVITLPKALISAIHLRLSGTGGSGTPAVDDLLATMKVKTKKGYIHDTRSADQRKLIRALQGYDPELTNASGAYTATNHLILFGRFLKDKAYMLDLRDDIQRLLEVTFGTLIATTAWATTTVKLTVTVYEWIGAPPSEWKGEHITWKEVENKATGTGVCTFDMFKDIKLAGLFLTIGTITSIAECKITDKDQKVLFGVVRFRDLVAEHQIEFSPETAETVVVLWSFLDKQPIGCELPFLNVDTPQFVLDRGATTSTSRLVQGIVDKN